MSSHLSTALWKARTEGGVITVDQAERPTTEGLAYATQGEVAALFDSEVVGWKLGATNDKSLELLGLERPFVGPLLSMHFHDTGDDLVAYAEHGPALETEFLVAMASDLPPRAEPYTDEEVKAAVEYVCAAFEIVGCRIEGGLTSAGLLLIADGAANLAVIPGEPSERWREVDFSDHHLSVKLNGTEVASGSSNLLMWGNPFGAVSYLARQPLVAECGLRAGDRIMTGTCGGLIRLDAGDEASADFGVLGTVQMRLADQS